MKYLNLLNSSRGHGDIRKVHTKAKSQISILYPILIEKKRLLVSIILPLLALKQRYGSLQTPSSRSCRGQQPLTEFICVIFNMAFFMK